MLTDFLLSLQFSLPHSAAIINIRIIDDCITPQTWHYSYRTFWNIE